MNELSWLIYLADVAGSAKGVAIAGAVAIGVACALCVGIGLMMIAEAYGNDDEKSRGTTLRDTWKKWIVAFSLLVAFATLVPSQNTIYAIAASEMGERVIQSETGDKAIQALNAWLDRQIAGKPDA